MIQNRIICAEISHVSTPISVREKVSLNKDTSQQALLELKQKLPEVYILSTCNRTAIYAYTNNNKPLKDFFSRFGFLDQYINLYDDTGLSVKNLMKTAAGIESQAIGEHQIMGQIRTSYERSKELKTMGPYLNEMVQKAVHTGKRVRNETNIGRSNVSVASIGYEVLIKEINILDKKTLIVIGTGNIANLITKLLQKHKFKQVFFASRSLSRAKTIAKEQGGIGICIMDLSKYIDVADIIIGGTEGALNSINTQTLKNKGSVRKKVFIDLGMPRNFETEIKDIEGVSLYDLDKLKEMTYEGIRKRTLEIPKAINIIEDELDDFLDWYKLREVSPIISNYWKNLEKIKEDELLWLLPKLGDYSIEQEKLIRKFAHRLIRKISNPSFKNFRTIADNKYEKESPIETLKKVFDMQNLNVFVPKKKIIVGTRGSKLALTQTQMVTDALRGIKPEYEYEIKVVRTRGDDGNLQETGAFTSALQTALINNEIDFAVHSLKDMPTETLKGTKLSAIPIREDARDVLISNDRKALNELKSGSVIGTGSLRRKVQLKKLRKDIKVKFIRGNVDSRINKMKKGEYDAIVLAASGLKRLGMIHYASQIFSIDEIMPAVNQGALAIEVREDDENMHTILNFLNDEESQICCEAERVFLNEVGGGCNMPYGAYAKIHDDTLVLKAIYSDLEGNNIIHEQYTSDKKHIREQSEKLAKKVLLAFK
jgi:hydroxymethylbilane synthase